MPQLAAVVPITDRDELIEHLRSLHPNSEFRLAGPDAFTQTIPATLHRRSGKEYGRPLTFMYLSLGRLGWQCTDVSSKGE